MNLGQAITQCQGKLRQVDLADRLHVTQATISRWVNNEHTPSLEDIRAIEDACGRPRGWIMAAIGMCPTVISVPEAIEADPALTDDGRFALRTLYRAYTASESGHSV